jgi:DNA-binding beta-propeller fold protein YncE
VVYEPGFQKVKAQIRVEFAVPYQGIFSADGRELYVTYRSTNKVAVIDTEKLQFQRAYDTDESPIGMVLAPDDDTLMVACFYQTPGSVVFLDRHTGKLKHRLEVPSSPSLLRKHPVNGLVYLSVSGDNRIVEIDPRVPKVLRVLDAGAFPVDLELVP